MSTGTHQNICCPSYICRKANETGWLTAVNVSCNPAATAAQQALQLCISATYKTNFAAQASGLLRVSATAAAQNVLLNLTASDSARVTLGGQVVAGLTITGKRSVAARPALALASLPIRSSPDACVCLVCVAGAGTTPISKTASVKLAAGDTAILIEVAADTVLALAPASSIVLIISCVSICACLQFIHGSGTSTLSLTWKTAGGTALVPPPLFPPVKRI